MAEKAPELTNRGDNIAQAKELYARGYRNYVVGDFNEAAEDLSRSCELYAQLFGDESEEVNYQLNQLLCNSQSNSIFDLFSTTQVAVPNLFYGKTLIELAQLGENKLLALPEQVDEDENDDEDDDGDDDEDTNGNDDDNENKMKQISKLFFCYF